MLLDSEDLTLLFVSLERDTNQEFKSQDMSLKHLVDTSLLSHRERRHHCDEVLEMYILRVVE